jgi:hypothetical protein
MIGYYYYYYYYIIIIGVRVGALGTAATIGLLYQHRMIDCCDCGATGGMKIGRGNRSTQRTATLSTTYPTCPKPGSNLDRRGGKPVTNRMDYGAAMIEY